MKDSDLELSILDNDSFPRMVNSKGIEVTDGEAEETLDHQAPSIELSDKAQFPKSSAKETADPENWIPTDLQNRPYASSDTELEHAKTWKHVLQECYIKVRDILPVYVILLALALYQWYRSLNSCDLDLAECVAIIKQQAPELMKRVAKFAFLSFLLLQLALRQKNTFAKALGVALVAATFLYIVSTSQGFTAQDHSQVNMALAVVLFIFFYLLYLMGYGVYLLWKKSKLIVLGLLLSLLLGALMVYHVRIAPSCKHLNDSLHPDYQYSESGSNCTWVKPTVCWHYAVKGLYRPVFWGRSTCSQYTTDVSEHKTVAGSLGVVSYPLTTQLSPESRMYILQLQAQTMSKLAPANQQELDNGDREVFIDFRKKPEGEVILKLRDVRSKLQKDKPKAPQLLPHDKEHMNVLHLFVDTVSRARFFRRFHKTVKIMQEYHFSQNKNIRAYEFFRFHALAPWTSPNLVSSVYGSTEGLEQPKKRVESYARQKGYVTGFTNNFCQANEVDHDFKEGYVTKQNFEDPQTPHHEMVQLACDYNSLPKENGMSFFFSPGPYTASRKCFLQKDLAQYSFDYTLQFFRTYQQERKFFTLRLIDPHEFSEEVAGFLDDPLSRFLGQMIAEGHLDNTIVYLNSDHGDHINFLFQDTASFRAEVYNPMLMVMIPDHQKDTMGKVIEQNTQKLLTHRDLFASDMKYLGFGDESQILGRSILQEQIPDRPCSDAKIGDCMCSPNSS